MAKILINAVGIKQKEVHNKMPWYIVGTMLLFSVGTGVLPSFLISLVIVICCMLLLFRDSVYLGFPFILFYGSIYGGLFGVSVGALYSGILLFSVLLRLRATSKPKLSYAFPLLVYFFFLVFSLAPKTPHNAIMAFISLISCVLVATVYLQQDAEALKRFFKIYVLVALVAFITGLIAGNTMEHAYEYENEASEVTRFLATFEDPNYMGYFYTIAVFAVFILRLFTPKTRIFLIVILYAMILASLSMSAIVINIVLWFVYFATSKKMNTKVLLIILLVLFIVYALYMYGLANRNAPVIGDLVYRLDSKWQSLLSNDLDAVTTNRSGLAQFHLKKFGQGSLTEQLFGGRIVTPYYIDPTLGRGAAHNEYVDMLLNIGILGTTIMLVFFLGRIFHYKKLYNQTHEVQYLFLFVSKFALAAYMFTLTVFFDYRFALMFFF